MPPQVPTSDSETLCKLLALGRTERAENTNDDGRTVRNALILLRWIAERRNESLGEWPSRNNLSVASRDVCSGRTRKGVLLRSAAKPATTPMVEQARMRGEG